VWQRVSGLTKEGLERATGKAGVGVNLSDFASTTKTSNVDDLLEYQSSLVR
jgi:hypothetical protein